jgi:hypothetical protein
MRFQPEKSEQSKKNMAALDHLFTTLASLDTTTLLNNSVILLDVPPKVFE